MFRWSESHIYWVAEQDSNSVCLTLQPVILTTILYLIIDLLEMHCYRKNKETNIFNKLYVSTGNVLLLYTHTHTYTHINTCVINILFGTSEKYFFTINNCRKKKRK